MASSTIREQAEAASVVEPMRKFSLKPRKSSYASSSRDGSSATNDSLSNSSRPSIAEPGRRRSSLASFSSRLRKSKKQTQEEQALQLSRKTTSSAALLFELPAEIQIIVLAYLSAEELLNFRLVSKQTLAILQANAPSITRNVFLTPLKDDGSSPPAAFLTDLYPSTFSSNSTDAYLLRSIRREALIRRQLRVMLTFIQTRVYMMKLTRNMESEQFGPYRRGLATSFYTPIGYLQHYLETVRHVIVHNHPNHVSEGFIGFHQCDWCLDILNNVIRSYPQKLIVPIYQTLQLFLQHLEIATRSPSAVPAFERKLRGWGKGPPTKQELGVLLMLGGISEVSKLDEMSGSYSKRLAIVNKYTDTIKEAIRINSLTFPDYYQTGHDPVMSRALVLSSKAKEKEIAPRSVLGDASSVSRAVEAYADSRPVTKSLDVELDILTRDIVASVPAVENTLPAAHTLLQQRIMSEELVDQDRELLSPYGWLQKTMVNSYQPEPVSHAAEDDEAFSRGL